MGKTLEDRDVRAFLHSFSEGIVLTDSQNTVRWINPMAEGLLGVETVMWTGRSVDRLLEERPDLSWIFRDRNPGGILRCWEFMECTHAACPLHGRPFTDCWAQKHCVACTSSAPVSADLPASRAKCAHCKVYNSHVVRRERDIQRTRDDRIVLHSNTTPLYDEDGTVLGSIHLLRDVTQDRELGRLKDDFFSTLSHELRSPLTSIRSYTEILMHYADETDPETQNEFLNIIHTESDRLDQMIDDMTELQQLESARSVWDNREISLPQIVQRVLQDYPRTLARRQIRCRTEMDPATPHVWSDPDKIYHVVSSLIQNLARRTPKQGTLLIRVQPMKGQRKRDSALFVKCTLTTLPMSPPQEGASAPGGAALGEAIRWDDPREKKKGLSLMFLLCKTILDQYGGRFWIESGEGSAGHAFHFTLPVDIPADAVAAVEEPAAAEGPEPAEGPAEVLPPIEKSRKRILVVDDDPRQVNSVDFALKKDGYKTYPTTSSLRALEIILESKPDLIISDVRMPEMDGYALFNELQKENSTKGIPFIFVSEPKEFQDRIRGLKSGVDDYLAKPYELAELLARVELLLRRAEQQETLSRQDDLTGALTRKAFEDSLDRELRQAKRDKRPMALVMADIDHFKRVNDTHGHLVGDFVLSSLVRFLKANLREEDILARYGGEEFCIIMPDTSKQSAAETLERIRKQLADKVFSYEREDLPVTITCSFGVSGFPSDSAAADGLIEKSDLALYQAKNLGRNLVVLYEKRPPGNNGPRRGQTDPPA